jgi:hypothetical protein
MTSIRLDQLAPESQTLLLETMAILDAWWDEKVGLLREAIDEAALPPANAIHSIRESGMYALGLLMRGQPGDKERANRILNIVLGYQFDAPDQPYHGTFYRYPEEPLPPAHSLIWRDYDPNWREFIGNGLAIVLQEFAAASNPAWKPAWIKPCSGLLKAL